MGVWVWRCGCGGVDVWGVDVWVCGCVGGGCGCVDVVVDLWVCGCVGVGEDTHFYMPMCRVNALV